MNILFEKIIQTKSIVLSSRPVWKCKSCPEYGIRPSCPPAVPSWQEAKEWLKSFNRAELIKFSIDMNNFMQDKSNCISYLLEKEKLYFKENNLYTFALFPGNCCLCEDCVCESGKSCAKPTLVRPSIESIGIELNKLVDINFQESVLYGMVLID